MQQVRLGRQPVAVTLAALFLAAVVWMAPGVTDLSGTASAQRAPTTLRESHVMIFTGVRYPSNQCNTQRYTTRDNWTYLACHEGQIGRDTALDFTIDGTRYPTGLVATFQAHLHATPNGHMCVRLYDLTTNEPVVGGQACLDSTYPDKREERVTAGPSKLAAAAHEYTLQYQLTPINKEMEGYDGWVFGARLYLSWD
jgi:hypothetical protein